MSFLDDTYPWMVGGKSSHEYFKIVKSNQKPGDKIQAGDKVAFKALYNNNAWKKGNPWLGCDCDTYCRRTRCPSESSEFHLFKFNFSNFS